MDRWDRIAQLEECVVCQKEFPIDESIDIWSQERFDTVCSPACLVDFAWKLKENQVKLSKSTSDDISKMIHGN